jgi:cytidylate kinase
MPIITISRGICTGGTELAELLRQRLGWRVLNQEEVSTAAADAYRMTQEELTRGLFMPASFYERFTQRKTRYLLATQATIAALAGDSNVIYHGLAGQFLLRDLSNAFKVRLVAPVTMRIENAIRRLGVGRDEASRRIREADEHRLLWGRQIFDADVNDPDLYDLVINLEHVRLKTAANLIAEVMEGKELHPDSAAVREFRDFALKKKIEAELFFNSPFAPDIAKVAVKGGEVSLTGGHAFESSEQEIMGFVNRIPGVSTLRSDRSTVEPVDIVFDPDSALSSRDVKASDVMLRLDQYPNCPGNCTIREAIVALSASAVKLDDGHFVMPRYLLIHDDSDQLVGVASRRELLKGLIPHFREDRESTANIREWLPFSDGTPSEIFIRWTSLFSRAALDAAQESVQTVIVPVRGTVQIDDSLSTVITTMLFYGVDMVAVLDGTKPVGVVLMTEIFDIVAQFVMEHGGRPVATAEGGGDDD